MAPIVEQDAQLLLGTFPVPLLSVLPNLRRWEIHGGGRTNDLLPIPILCFHKAALARLRYWPIEELHLRSVKVSSVVELTRLVASFPRLRHLGWDNVDFDVSGRLSFGARRLSTCRRLCGSVTALDVSVLNQALMRARAKRSSKA